MAEVISYNSWSWTALPVPAVDPPSFIGRILSITQSYVMLVIMVIGMLGNALSFVIFFRKRKRADACVQYLSCLAVSDTGVIITRGWTEWVNFGLKYITNEATFFDVIKIGTLSCKLMFFSQQVTMCISAWMIVAFSIERAFVVWFPLKRVIITQRKRNIVISFVCFSMILASVHRLIFLDVVGGNTKVCYYIGVSIAVGNILYQFDVTLYNYAACIIIFNANILIVLALFKSRRTELKKSTQKSPVDGKILVSLMLVSTLYVALLMPFTAASYLLYNRANLTKERGQFVLGLLRGLFQLASLNYCLNFIIYGCTLPFYREEARKIFTFTCKKAHFGRK
jgi:hypothetical protein